MLKSILYPSLFSMKIATETSVELLKGTVRSNPDVQGPDNILNVFGGKDFHPTKINFGRVLQHKTGENITCLHTASVMSSKCPEDRVVQSITKWQR